MNKRETILLSIILTALFLVYGTVLVSADSYEKYGIYINSTKLETSAAVKDFGGFGYIPLNLTKSLMNITITEDKAANSITITSGAKSIKITNKTLAELNGGIKLQLDAPIVLADNNIYFPLISVTDLLNYKIEILDDIKCIRLKSGSDNTPAGRLVDAELNKALPASKAVSSPYPKTAYLTFDDGLDAKITPMILDILKEHDVKATFFIVGNTIEKNKSLLKRMVDEGHSIGNHTFTHRREIIYSNPAGLQSEIEKTNAAIYKAVGIVTRLFRPPYGAAEAKKEEFRAVLTPYRTVMWNVDSGDSKSLTVTSTEIVNNVINQVKNKKNAVIIMHDSSTRIETVKALPEIIKHLKENGFTILPIKENTNIGL